ncbi:alpha/beta hydrolase [Actinomadura sp. HBU206391]|uniref:alpha/beta hydrolase n=1 Tax=Actinomadura sp. HBU206391 TaxID=2731692 RepID=UPI00164FF579|nr:alpha/beta hydrolase [Actinomadura sp. HBU206391]MBC6459855.1 alpha/beta hydrolase [Actinomadura sp. HBU206391]
MNPDPSPFDRRPSMQSRAISRALRLGVRPFVSRLPGNPVSLRTARTAADAAARLIRSGPRVRVEQLVDPCTDATARPVVGEWVTPIDPDVQEGAILYLHGGGYVACSPRTHRPITARLAVDCELPVLVPRYRLAPEHPFPAALFDAVDAYRLLLARGIPGSKIVVAGDSAGGHLAASMVGEICRTDLPTPAGVVLYSPWVDLTCELSSERDESCRDPYVSLAAARLAGQMYVGTGDFDDPRLSLLTCKWTSAPPFFVQVGGGELLRAEAERLAEVLSAAGTTCELQVWVGQMHVFQILNHVLPEARAAMLETARFVRTAISAPAVGGVA